MDQRSQITAPKVICPQVPPGLTDEKLALYHEQVAQLEESSNAPLPHAGSGDLDDDSGSEDSDETESPLERVPGYGTYTLVPDLPPIFPAPYNDPSPPPTNALLHIYSMCSSPAEGMSRVADYIGEFMCLLRTEMPMAGLFVMPCSGELGYASQCGDHWYLGAPMQARLGFVLPTTGSWQDAATVAQSHSPVNVAQSAPSRPVSVPASADATKEIPGQGALQAEEEDEGPSESESDLAIYIDDAPVTREPNRFFKDSEILQAIKDIKLRSEHLEDAEAVIKAIDWNQRKRICHLHLSACLYEHLGNTNFQEIPERLHKNRMRIVGWPEECELPPNSSVGMYNAEKVRNMLLGIWRGTFILEPWGEGKIAEPYPPLIVDSAGKKHNFLQHLTKADVESDIERSPMEGSEATRDTPEIVPVRPPPKSHKSKAEQLRIAARQAAAAMTPSTRDEDSRDASRVASPSDSASLPIKSTYGLRSRRNELVEESRVGTPLGTGPSTSKRKAGKDQTTREVSTDGSLVAATEDPSEDVRPVKRSRGRPPNAANGKNKAPLKPMPQLNVPPKPPNTTARGP